MNKDFTVRAGCLLDVEHLVKLSDSLPRDQASKTKPGFFGVGFGATAHADFRTSLHK